MEASKFNSLLKYANIEWYSGNTFLMHNQEEDQFIFYFNMEDAVISEQGKLNLSETQQEKINNHIIKWCEQEMRQINSYKHELLRMYN